MDVERYELEILNSLKSHIVNEMSSEIRCMAKSYYNHILTIYEFSEKTIDEIKQKLSEIDDMDKYEEKHFLEQRVGEKSKDYMIRLHKRYFPEFYDAYGNEIV